MTYASATSFLSRFGAAEIAQRADRGIPRLVTAQLLLDAAAGADLSSYTSTEVTRVATVLALVNQALADAADTINSYISGRYTVPLSGVPGVLERTACELARYNLYDDQVTDVIKARYDASIKYLTSVSRGDVSLGVDEATSQPVPSSAGAELVTAGRVWQRGDSQGFL